MKKIRIGFIVCAGLLIIVQLGRLFFGNLDNHGKMGSYLGIAGMVLLIIAMIMGRKNDKKNTDFPD